MLVHKFQRMAGNAVILTRDRGGDNLPGGSVGWVYEKSLELYEGDPDRIGASSKEILDGISSCGYFKWPDGGR